METDTVVGVINEKFDKILNRSGTSVTPFICIVCDRFLKPAEIKYLDKQILYEKGKKYLKPTKYNNVSLDQSKCYEYVGDESESWMKTLLLSPRSSYYKNQDRRKAEGFTCCSCCKNSLRNDKIPQFAIANNYAFGDCPACLSELTSVELAMLTPVKTYGYVFSYTGGQQSVMKGSLSYYKISLESVVRTVMHFDVLNLHNNVVILLYGRLTMQQKEKARQYASIRTEHILTAMKWLMIHNVEWSSKEIDLDKVRQSLCTPTLIDRSTMVNNGDDITSQNIEKTETIEIFFPDGTIDHLGKGQESLEKFRELVKATKEHSMDLCMKADYIRESVYDFKDNNLVNSCLLQFPYGRGGMHEDRFECKKDEWTMMRPDIQEYVEHLTMVAQPQFQKQHFVLILYNMKVKQNMVRNASYRCRSAYNATSLACELTEEDLSRALSHNRGDRPHTPGAHLLSSVDTICASVPHTNDATRKAKRTGEAMQHAFGIASIFLTVSPDDDNSYIVQVLSDIPIDDDTPVDELSDEDLMARAKKRTQLRINNPGVCALYFELVMDIVIEHVIGWNVKKGEAYADGGLLGKPLAFLAAIEEQGRRSLHAHMQVWIDGFGKQRENLHSTNARTRLESFNSIVQLVDRTGTTMLIDCDRLGRNRHPSDVFPHECQVSRRHRLYPKVVDDQGLRKLRHNVGYKSTGGLFAFCPSCTKVWTAPEFVNSYLYNEVGIAKLKSYPDHKTKRLKTMVINYQKSTESELLDPSIIHAAYDHHIHCEKTCFSKTDKKKSTAKTGKRKRGCECRMRYPQRKKEKTTICNASVEKVKWYKWDGTFQYRFIKEICIRRDTYDVFQNVSCRAITESKLGCNSNISVLMPGPISQYTFKYNLKDCQDEESESYGNVAATTRRMLSSERNYDSDRSEAMRRLLAASFAHQKSNICGAPMASYLTRNHSRFIFSHGSKWAPIRDLKSLLNKGTVVPKVINNGQRTFFECDALHYLCRPTVLDHENVFTFFSECEVITKEMVRNGKENEISHFENTQSYTHPSYVKTKDKCRQRVRKRSHPVLIKIFQFDFPDTASFNGPLLSSDTMITSEMEKYCENVLLLFLPFRELSDLQDRGSFTQRLRRAVHHNHLPSTCFQYLQNIQDSKSNCFRVMRTEDDLQRVTDEFTPVNDDFHQINHNEDDDDEDEDLHIQGDRLDEWIRHLQEECLRPTLPEILTDGNSLPTKFSIKDLQNKGANKCGFENVARMKPNPVIGTSIVQLSLLTDDTPLPSPENVGTQTPSNTRSSYKEVVSILLTKVQKRTRSFKEISGCDDDIELDEANGSVKSIVDWSRKSRLDKDQRLAFEIFTSQFVLSFYKRGNETETDHNRHEFITNRRKLKRLARIETRGSEQMICMLHGPGGSGKTSVLDLLQEYAREYCGFMEDYQYSERTIVVTAMSGVAATILMGETTHRALHLNKRKPIDEQDADEWYDTRLVIVDEVSFADCNDFSNMNSKVNQLKQRPNARYGDIDVIFSGDFFQLEPCGGKGSVYKSDCPEFRDFVNTFIELKGKHRFRKDKEWGDLLFRVRDGSVTETDIEEINKRVVKDETVIPDDIRYATFYNRDRDAINSVLFETRCRELYDSNPILLTDSVMVFSSDVECQNGSRVYEKMNNVVPFWQHCGESDARTSKFSGRMDPVLKLYVGCRVILTVNENVRGGQANGTQATIQKVVLKAGKVPRPVMLSGNIPINSVLANEVRHIVLEHSNERIQPRTFSVHSKKNVFTASMPLPLHFQRKRETTEKLKMSAVQFPIVVNNATTGHKLQGSGVDNLYVTSWSDTRNWNYVILSRVKTRSGLFLRKALKVDTNIFKPDERCVNMLNQFKQRKPEYWDDLDYDHLLA